MMTPPIGVPDLNMSAAAAPFLTTQPVAAPNIPIQKSGGLFGGMFGGGGNAQMAIMAAISGLMARRHPEVSQMMQGLLAHRMTMQQGELEKQRELQNQIGLYNYKLAHPEPGQPHYFQDNSGNELAVGDDGKVTTVYNDPNPWKLVPNGMGGVIPVNMQALMKGANPSMPPPGMPAIGAVVPDPRLQGGAGAAVPPQTFPY